MRCWPVTIKGPNGPISVIVRGNRRLWAKCVCDVAATRLCDYPIAPGRTCDVALCASHAVRLGHNLDYCHEHAREMASALPESAQLDLFGGADARDL